MYLQYVWYTCRDVGITSNKTWVWRYNIHNNSLYKCQRLILWQAVRIRLDDNVTSSAGVALCLVFLTDFTGYIAFFNCSGIDMFYMSWINLDIYKTNIFL